MSINNICTNDDPTFKPVYSWDTSTFFNINTAFYLRALWKICTLFMPARWAYLVQLIGGEELPDTIPKELIPQRYGGTNPLTFQQWLEDCAKTDGVTLETPPRQLVEQRVLDQFGQNNGMIASAIPDTELNGWMWKRTNVGHRWHHYYFVLLKDGLLYYFKSVDDTDAQNG